MPKNHDFNKLRKRLTHCVGEAIADFNMIEEGDRVMVCLSGGADSYSLLEILRDLQSRAPIDFELVAVNLDQKQPGFPEKILPEYLASIGVEYRIVEQDTYRIVKEKIPEGQTTCSLCSRLRRGILYKTAKQIGASKIALGHHMNDMVETLFLNMFYGARMKTMPAKLISDDKQNVVIRPLAYCKEADIKRFAAALEFPIIPCNLCGSQENLQRQAIKSMLAQWELEQPGRLLNVFRSMQRIAPSHMLDRSLFDFTNLR